MDIIEHLTQEHRKAEQLLAQLEDTEAGPERDRLVEELVGALSTHMAVEEQFVYPIVIEVLGQEPETEAETEHQLARDGLEQLQALADAPGFGAVVAMLTAGIAHHVREEEQEVFPALRSRAADQLADLDPDELEASVQDELEAGGGVVVEGMTKDELYRKAQEAGVPGRSTMTKEELAEALEQG